MTSVIAPSIAGLAMGVFFILVMTFATYQSTTLLAGTSERDGELIAGVTENSKYAKLFLEKYPLAHQSLVFGHNGEETVMTANYDVPPQSIVDSNFVFHHLALRLRVTTDLDGNHIQTSLICVTGFDGEYEQKPGVHNYNEKSIEEWIGNGTCYEGKWLELLRASPIS